MKFTIRGFAEANTETTPTAVADTVQALFDVDFRNYRRAGKMARVAMTTGALALFRAGQKPDDAMALLGISPDGALEENQQYWADYWDNGRQAGRGHLFVGTLPSTPLCETAIALGLHGPAYYSSAEPGVEIAALLADGARGVLVVAPRGALYVEPGEAQEPALDLLLKRIL